MEADSASPQALTVTSLPFDESHILLIDCRTVSVTGIQGDRCSLCMGLHAEYKETSISANIWTKAPTG